MRTFKGERLALVSFNVLADSPPNPGVEMDTIHSGVKGRLSSISAQIKLNWSECRCMLNERCKSIAFSKIIGLTWARCNDVQSFPDLQANNIDSSGVGESPTSRNVHLQREKDVEHFDVIGHIAAKYAVGSEARSNIGIGEKIKC